MKKLMTLMIGVTIIAVGILPGCGNSEPVDLNVISEEVSWPIGDTTVYATITRPETGKNYPAIVFIAGSGPTDRDWNSPLLPGTNGSAKLLAEELAAKGYVTIRYDKRVAGEHATENIPELIGKISMQSHLEELSGAVEMVAGREDVDAEKIFVLANSEGTIHAVNYQVQAETNRFAGMILTGTPGQSTGDLAHTQIAAQVAVLPGADEIMKLYDEAITDFLANGTMQPDESLLDGIKIFLSSLVNPVNMPFTQELWTANIIPDLDRLGVPVLVIIGKKDIQVDWQVDGTNLEEAAQGLDKFTFAFPENANHILKNEPKPKDEINLAAPNYNGADTVLDPETLDIIETWLETNS